MNLAPENLLRAMFDAAVASARAAQVVPGHLPPIPKGRTVVVGAGKAAAEMAASVEHHWAGNLAGTVVVPYGHGAETRRIEVIEAAHPISDHAGVAAAGRVLACVKNLGADDLVLCLISGGASALLALPAPGLTLTNKQAVTQSLLRSGASIAEMNCVRKHLSAIKGGRLAAAAWPAPTVTLAVSDVPGDDPATIGSGPTVADPTTFADARSVLSKYGVDVPPAIAAYLERASEETPKPGDRRLRGTRVMIVADAGRALQQAAAIARAHGVTPVILGEAVEGEARAVAVAHARCLDQDLAARPYVLLSGGETAVTVRGCGRGGRNSEYLLALAIALAGRTGVYALAADTDGVDGTEPNAGAAIRPDSLTRAQALGYDAQAMLADNDAYSFFAALDDLVVTGPTRTNVNDFRAILVT